MERLRNTLALTGNLRILALVSFLSQISAKMLEVIWQPFVLSLGASMPILGALQSARSIIASLVQPFSGRAAGRRGRKPFVILASLLTLADFVLCIVARTWLFLIPAIAFLGTTFSVTEAR